MPATNGPTTVGDVGRDRQLKGYARQRREIRVLPVLVARVGKPYSATRRIAAFRIWCSQSGSRPVVSFELSKIRQVLVFFFSYCLDHQFLI